MIAWGYEFYLLVLNVLSALEDKIHSHLLFETKRRRADMTGVTLNGPRICSL